MKIPNRERWSYWNEIKYLSVDIKSLGTLFQNEMELSDEDVLAWSRRVAAVSSKLASLNKEVLAKLADS